MGLDMYLDAHKYIGGKFRKIKEPYLTVSKNTYYGDTEKQEDFSEFFVVPTKDIKFITYEIGYWRKANWIHKWFVDNVQHGVDDCHQYCVSDNDIEKLKGICEWLLKNKNRKDALNFLPPYPGFFFGYNNPEELSQKEQKEFWEYYWSTLEDTVKFLEKALDLYEKGYDITYSSSW